MAYKEAFVAMVPDGDPKKHRTSIKTAKFEFTAVLTKMDIDEAVSVCKELVQNEGIHSVTLCPGFSHEAVAKVKRAVGEKVAVQVARGDKESMMIVGEILAREGWLSKTH